MRDLSDLRWKKSSRSGAGNNCVEVATLNDGRAVRDSNNPTGGLRCDSPQPSGPHSQPASAPVSSTDPPGKRPHPVPSGEAAAFPIQLSSLESVGG
jgi:hypothetical protein